MPRRWKTQEVMVRRSEFWHGGQKPVMEESRMEGMTVVAESLDEYFLKLSRFIVH